MTEELLILKAAVKGTVALPEKDSRSASHVSVLLALPNYCHEILVLIVCLFRVAEHSKLLIFLVV